MNPSKICGAVKTVLSPLLSKDGKKESCCAILLAAGSGSRMGGVPKCFLPLGDSTVLGYSLRAFSLCHYVHEIVVVTKQEWVEDTKTWISSEKFDKVSAVVVGGDTRQKSAANGFYAASSRFSYVAIHDAARPFIKTDDITQIFEAAFQYQAGCAAHPVTDTIKTVNSKGMITSTVPRKNLFAVQTPQIFKKTLYEAALAVMKKENSMVTDDCMMAEHARFTVKLVDIGHYNIKLTTPEDYALAKAKLAMEDI
ncbi:MAG TPA: 2-C-methyl-D-erythritol 4-phosphate cytidylyltransferase [Clostridiales bacterium]|jgi:2-C-methyl-D-erythritol 4-phosphate cytidylyltransferase|nr:2-C-methyl-D-erythritol 4-phosphate cytidylyltransferase [Clostridiales bacterium]